MKPGYRIRTPLRSELPAILDTVNAAGRAGDATAAAQTVDEYLRVWSRLDTERDAWVVTGPGGEIAGYGHVTAEPDEGRAHGDAYTHPGHEGAGIGTRLLELTETRAAELASGAGRPLRLVNYVYLGGVSERLLRARGYRLARIHQRMAIALDGPPPAPVWPDGVTLRSCTGTAEDLRAVHACVEDAFGDLWGAGPRPYDVWADDLLYDGFDPSLWLLAERAGRIAGAALCRFRDVRGEAAGEVGQLAVGRQDRRLGIGHALLLSSFALFAGRGASSVGLDVDSESLTGAHLLYARAGMAVTVSIGRFEREVSCGTAAGVHAGS
ncbi:GNAT family N-acetyltransferase [Streptomyces sp. NBC_00102]|uniref:GNAT family N-acetyltransferase n=1 Tax=Streptomyces sp. NBC_00102 TaxID=2975652 RepID=UPI002255179C|nr:GNAT family N-acetyltransferase [Streptomyces sp. NBC_00102]MCX5400566.1 GNAT family N-acetyltransferase [Streptomyces sp. NBC_00102]